MIRVLAGEEVSAILAILDDYTAESGIIRANGTGNDMTHHMLSFLAEGLAGAGHLTLRSDFPYREQEKKSPDSYDALCVAWQSACRLFHADSECPERILGRPNCFHDVAYDCSVIF